MAAATEALKRVKAHTRYVTADGQRVPGCTTITGILNKPALVGWANRLGLEGVDVEEYVDVLAGIGTLVHTMILADCRREEVDIDTYTPEQVRLAENAFLSYLSWRKAHTVIPVLVEQPLVSGDHRFGGTPDLVAEVDGTLELVDFKSGSGIYPEHLHQVCGGYKLLVNEHGYNPQRIRIVRIPRAESEAFEEHLLPAGSCQPHVDLFLHALAIYRIQQGFRKRPIGAKKS
uniref:PD-(D/E)XK endonuclease-like domain-containing protein n=1 Tax=viral metagenome TaxID=1070528 RepID=A0A6M3LG56_9ZZZZ